MSRSARFLVTGGAGFIGSQLALTLAARGFAVRVVDNLVNGHWSNLDASDAGASIERVEADIRDGGAMFEAMRGVEVVLHQAALGSVPRSVADPVETNAVNVGGTVTVLDAARRAGVRRVVMASSSSVYGDTEALPKREDMAPRPLSPYAVSKLAGEEYARVFTRSYGLETACLRYFNVFGPHQRPDGPYAAAIPRFVDAALRGEPIVLFGDGLQTRDFCFVANAVEANILAATTPRPLQGDVLNVAGGRRVALRELAEMLVARTGRHTPIHTGPPRAGDVRDSLADVSRARDLLGYVPEVRWEDGLAPTIAFLTKLHETKEPP